MEIANNMVDGRKIIHVDMDAFYVAVEVLDQPSLAGAPVIVGGRPDSRSVVCSASYEARKFGIRSGMACSVAKRLCPKAVFLSPHFDKYKEYSLRIHQIFRRYTDIIESVALDEAWLDVTVNPKNIPSATWIAELIKKQIRDELRLTCSAGVSYNKFLAKIASDEKKPDGLFVITPEDAPRFLLNMDVRKIPGVGKVTQKRLESLDVKVGSQLLAKSESFLVSHFGKMGKHLYCIIRGEDARPVHPCRERKSVSVENTFQSDLVYGKPLVKELETLVEDLIVRLEKHSAKGKTLTLKVKFSDFQLVARSVTKAGGFSSAGGILPIAMEKLKSVCCAEFSGKGVRLIGVGISNLFNGEAKQNKPVQLDFLHLLKAKPVV